MQSDRWGRLQAVLDAVLDSERASWPSIIAERCGDDAELRGEVEGLLAHLETAERMLNAPPARVAAAILTDSDETWHGRRDGERIGAYRVVREVGRGGMSRVFLAERADGQFQQRVALKLLRPGLDSELDRERFRFERQVLATLNHPNIARLLDGGLTKDGQPYLVMEYVEGQTISEHAAARGLTLRARVELFLSVLAATQAAHRNLVIHRDLKPGNILVTEDGTVKLLDFGLAKLLEPEGGDSHSRTVQRWLTPEYAAPEQIRGEAVTTVTDVWQLGAVLCELLSGAPPFGGRRSNQHELERAILDDDPVVRSPALPEDLTAVVLKALQKKPEQRYASVEAFAGDLRRFLDGYPVTARKQTRSYRAARFIRRHFRETLTAAGVVIALVGSVVVSAWQAHVARGERDRADAAAVESEAVTEFLVALFGPVDATQARNDALTVREMLARGLARIEQLRGQPGAQARMLEVTARAQRSLGAYDEAERLLRQALRLRRSLNPNPDLQIASTLRLLSEANRNRGNYAAADSALREAIKIQESLLGVDDPAVATTLHELASISIFRGDLRLAESYHRRALDIRTAALGADDTLTSQSHMRLAATLRRRGDPNGAERHYRRALASLERQVGPAHRDIAQSMLSIAYLLADDPKRNGQAEAMYGRALEVLRRVYGPEHPLVGSALGDFAGYQSLRGEHDKAVEMARRYVEIMRSMHGPDHPNTLFAAARAAMVLHRAGEPGAEAMLRDARERTMRLLGRENPDIAGLNVDLASILLDRNDYAGAERLARDAVRIRNAASGPGHPATAKAKGFLARVLLRKGSYRQADTVVRDAIASLERHTSRQHPDVRELYELAADISATLARHAEARRYREIARGP